MTSQRIAFVIAAAGILVMSALVMYDAGLLGVQHVVVSGLQARPWDTAFMIKVSDINFEGIVKSTENKHVYEPPEIQSPEEDVGKLVVGGHEGKYGFSPNST